jgi:hypothetical protein
MPIPDEARASRTRVFKKHEWRAPNYLRIFPVFAGLFAVFGIYYCMASSWQSGVCVDCERQREIADEVYFGKKAPVIKKGYYF